MERKTQVKAEENNQSILITRSFDIPLDLLFKAYTEAELIAQWMGTEVVRHESRPFGSYHFQTKDPDGNIVFQAKGVIHDFKDNEKITRTFEMIDTPFDVQLEILNFQKSTDSTSLLTIRIIYTSVEMRNQMLQIPFAQGLSRAHDLLEKIAKIA